MVDSKSLSKQFFLKSSYAIGATAFITSDSSSRLGLLTDISRGGLAFRYLELETVKGEPAGWAELKVFWDSRCILIVSLPCRVIEDCDVSPEYSFSLVLMRKCTVEFGNLAPDQAAQLEHLMDQDFAYGNPPNPGGVTGL